MPKKAKAKPLKVIYHHSFCSTRLGEADGFFEFKNPKEIRYITGWFAGDARWEGEFMSGLIHHLGAEIEPLAEEFHRHAEDLMASAYGL